MFKSLRQKIQSLDKKKQNILVAVFVLMDFLIIIFIISFWGRLKKMAPEIAREKPVNSIEKQLEKLNALRRDVPPLTEEEKEQQLKELEKLQKKTAPSTSEQLLEQLKELNKLRKSQ